MFNQILCNSLINHKLYSAVLTIPIIPSKKKEDSAEVKYENILEKLDQLCTGRNEDKNKLDRILSDTTKLQEDFARIQTEVMELKNGIQSMDEQIVDLQKDAELKVGIQAFEKFKEDIKIDNLENRSKRNNLVFWNIQKARRKIGAALNYWKI